MIEFVTKCHALTGQRLNKPDHFAHLNKMIAFTTTTRGRTVPYTVYPESHRCENCMHWRGDALNKLYATIGKSRVWVGQCAGQENDNEEAPYADLDNGAEAFVFTPDTGRCRAFAFHPDVEADYATVAIYERRLDDDLRRDAWM